jgi:hypothetical protein
MQLRKKLHDDFPRISILPLREKLKTSKVENLKSTYSIKSSYDCTNFFVNKKSTNSQS